MDTQTLLDQCDKSLADNKTQLDNTAQEWETAARNGCPSVEKLEADIDQLKTVGKRLALRRSALVDQLAADTELSRAADVERLTGDLNKLLEGITKQYAVIEKQSDALVKLFDSVLADGQATYDLIHKLQMLGCDQLPSGVMNLAMCTQQDKANNFHNKQKAVYALSERIQSNAMQRIKPQR